MKYLVFILLISCNPFSVNTTSTYTIKKGEHKSVNKLSPVYSEEVTFLFNFNSTHLYLDEIPDNDNRYDINKLYGITSSNIHKNSARFGWRQKIDTDSIEVFAYWYKRGIRGFKLLGTVGIGEHYMYMINTVGHSYVWEYEPYLYDGTNTIKFVLNDTKNISTFRSFPYFGGDNVAPHRMYFNIIEK